MRVEEGQILSRKVKSWMSVLMAKRERSTHHLYNVQKAVLNHTSTLGWFKPKRTVKEIMNDPQAEGDSHMSTQSNTIGSMDLRCG